MSRAPSCHPCGPKPDISKWDEPDICVWGPHANVRKSHYDKSAVCCADDPRASRATSSGWSRSSGCLPCARPTVWRSVGANAISTPPIERGRRPYRLLYGAARALYADGERSTMALLDAVSLALARTVDSVDYIELRDAMELTLPITTLSEETRAVRAVVLKIGPTRLIDNSVLGEVDVTLD